MKKLTALLLTLIMMLSLAACGGSDDAASDSGSDADAATEESKDDASAESDLAYVKDKGTLVVGITDFEPMDYKEEGSDEWVGFDADMAKAFADSLGVDVEFLE